MQLTTTGATASTRASRWSAPAATSDAARCGVNGPDFDVISEFVFDNRAAYDAMLATHNQPEVKAAIEADEANFLDRSRTRMYLVDTYES